MSGQRIEYPIGREVPRFGRDGQMIKSNGSRIDIDDRNVAEEELIEAGRESQRREFYLAEAQRLGNLGSWVFDPATGFEHWSHELFKIHGLDPLQGPPTPEQYLALVHPEDREFMASMMERLLSDNSGFDVTKRIVRAGENIRYVRCVGNAVSDNVASRRIGIGIDVTDHEILTKELRRHEAYFAEAQRLSRTGSFGWKTSSGEIDWSDETYSIFEYDRAEKPTLDRLTERVHPQDRAFFQQVLDRASQSGNHFEHEYRLQLPDGRVKHVHQIAHALPDESGNQEFIGAVSDITERKMAEEKIRHYERELRTLVDAIPAYVGTALPDGSVDFMSQSWLNYTGLSKEQGMGWGWERAIHPEDSDRVLVNWRNALAAGTPVEHEVRFRRADGCYQWFLNRCLPLRDDEGNIIKWYATNTNIDELKQTECALQAQEKELAGIIETIPSMLWSASPTGEVTHISKRLREYTGFSLEDFLNLGWKRIIHPDDFEETSKAFSRAIQTGGSYCATHRLRQRDGEYRWYHAAGEPLRDSDGGIIQWYGLSIDIDERKRAEDHLRDTRIRLAKASRLATVAELAASIAHQMSQPLMSILSNAQAARRWLMAERSNIAEVNSSIERIVRDAHAADEAMQHVRALFKQESFDKKNVHISDLLHEVIRIVQEDPKKRDVLIECQFGEPLPMVLVDQIQLQQVFINLIVNAIEALEPLDVAPLVILRTSTGSNGMLIQVIDNGPGVDDPEHIFDTFMTTKEAGMGIGLAVSRSIVQAHGGRLWAENGPDGGARFNVSLPLSPKNGDPGRSNESGGLWF
jgi:PAS domain S-box-containing protein